MLLSVIYVTSRSEIKGTTSAVTALDIYNYIPVARKAVRLLYHASGSAEPLNKALLRVAVDSTPSSRAGQTPVFLRLQS